MIQWGPLIKGSITSNAWLERANFFGPKIIDKKFGYNETFFCIFLLVVSRPFEINKIQWRIKIYHWGKVLHQKCEDKSYLTLQYKDWNTFQDVGFTADPIDDNIYQWCVKLFDFDVTR